MFTPLHSSPLARTPQFRDSHPSMRSIIPAISDEDERHTTGHPKRRETICSNFTHQTPKSTRFSTDTVLGIIKSYEPNTSPKVPCPSPSHEITSTVDVGSSASSRTPKDTASKTTPMIPSPFSNKSASLTTTTTTTTTTIATIASTTTSPTPLIYSDLTSKNLRLLENAKTPKCKSARPSMPSLHLSDLPIRLSPLRSPSRLPPSPTSSKEEAARPRKPSLTDPHLHKQPSQYVQDLENPARFPVAHPPTPSTPPSTSRGGHSYHSSLGTPPYSQAHVRNPSEPLPGYASHPHMSITSTESSSFLSGLAHSPTTTIATSPRSRESHASYGMQHTMSAWDEWDSEEEEEKVGLVKYWRGRKWRSSRGSLGGIGVGRRESVGNDETDQEENGVVGYVSPNEDMSK
ncbi:hypothetical protein DM02DRAFT_711051 [Periconia macrospinosa]|uniref:Uncharacterized protein n=1 Tax=Periconia macrospinosa TaxID=97972 RepID=A0A2V1EB60_9PLEO|nr:hypothetical protein DM02DRAFT_711051 [Periconia macrospinosa]